MKFQYKAKNQEGQIQTGTVVAADQTRAEQLLEENGLVIISLETEQENSLDRMNPFGKSVKNKDLVLFSRQLATLISARVPIIQALRILEEQVAGKYLLEVISALISSVQNGESLSLAMSKFPKVFGTVYISLVKSGEVSGNLDKALTSLADQLEKEYELGGKIKSAMAYPTFVVSALVLVALLMFKFVLPNLTSVLIQQGGQLPITTEIIIAFANFFNKFWWLLIIGIIALIAGVRFYISTPVGRYQWDGLKIHIPLIGDIFQKIYLSRFARNLSTLTAGGIPVIQALQIVAEVVNNVIYRDIILSAVTQITAGKSISEGLMGHPEFPNLVTQMVKVGEQTAEIDTILAKLAVFYEKEVDNKVATLTTLLEPLIMVVLGVGVGILVAGILLPIYNLADTSGGSVLIVIKFLSLIKL